MSNEIKIGICDLCGCQKLESIFYNHDRLLGRGESYNLVKCSNCGLIFINPLPSANQLLESYDRNRYSVFANSGRIKNLRDLYTLVECTYYHTQFKDYPAVVSCLSKIIFYPLRPMFRSTKFVECGNFLDVGCGSCNFLISMKYLGMIPYGVEPGEFDEKIVHDHNLNVFKGKLYEAKYDDNFFDVITLNHVLEHVGDPTETFSELYRILKPGGYLIVAVPLSNSLAFKLFGKYWSQLDTPRHLYIFKKSNLMRYAKKFDFGVIKIRYNSTPSYQFVLSTQYFIEGLFNRKFDVNFTHNICLNLILMPLSIILNLVKLGDQCEVIMTKK